MSDSWIWAVVIVSSCGNRKSVVRENDIAVFHFAHWDEQGVSRTLFPQHHLTLIHHETRIDATKTCLLAGVLVQLRKPPAQRGSIRLASSRILRSTWRLSPQLSKPALPPMTCPSSLEYKGASSNTYPLTSARSQTSIPAWLRSLGKLKEWLPSMMLTWISLN